MSDSAKVSPFTKLLIDGVEPQNVYRVTLDLDANDVARLRVEQYVSTIEFNGFAEVTNVEICPCCKREVIKP